MLTKKNRQSREKRFTFVKFFLRNLPTLFIGINCIIGRVKR